MPSFPSIRSVERAFAVLRAMNRTGISRISELEAMTGLPASTIVRIVETLTALGYVRNHGHRSGYSLTERVLELSAGFHGLPPLLECARDVLKETTGAIRWPAALATLDGTSMVVRLSTIPDSPLAHTHSTLQKRLDLLDRAHGRAYLASCPEEERRSLYRRLHDERVTDLSPEELHERMQPVLARIRHAGHAERAHTLDPQTSTLAMAVVNDGHVLATLGVTFFRGARADRKAIIRAIGTVVERLKAPAGGLSPQAASFT